MRIQSELCHIDDKRAIVSVSAWHDDKPLGNTLGEGHSINLAEDNGIERLLKRLRLGKDLENYYLEKQISSNPDDHSTKTSSQRIHKKNVELNEASDELVNSTEDKQFVEYKHEPDEWSKELAELDLLIKKLKWTRIEENNYLLETFGYADRNRITSYKDILKYLTALRNKNNIEILEEDDPDTSKYKLIKDSDDLFKKLAWSTRKAREFLKLKMNLTSRQQLSHEQLLQFNNLLEVELKEIKDNNSVI